jgi:WD40 repeat protein
MTISKIYGYGLFERLIFLTCKSLFKSIASIRSDDDTPFDSLNGFVGGDFAAGKLKDIRLPTGCWAMAFSERADILAVGLKDQVDFLETTNYTTIYTLPRTDKVSAIQWCRGSALCPKTTLAMINDKDSDDLGGDLIAVSGLDGRVALYQLDLDLLELQGVQVLHQFNVHCQVRCMAMRPLGNGKLLLAVGDKQGRITLTTLMRGDDGQVDGSCSVVVDLEKDPVLGLDIHAERSILAASTKSGKVIVNQLFMTKHRTGKTYAVCSSRLWTTQRSGAVRAVVIRRDGKQIAFGGYDKTLVLVDTNLYAVVRELTLGGTVRYYFHFLQL